MTPRDTTTTGCPICYGLTMFGDKWTLLIIRDMLFFGKRYYGEFLESGEGISTNILADRLNSLEQNGIVNKTRDSENQSRYIYTLTEKGQELLPIMLSIVEWGARHDKNTRVPKPFLEKYKANPKKFQKELLAAMKRGESLVR